METKARVNLWLRPHGDGQDELRELRELLRTAGAELPLIGEPAQGKRGTSGTAADGVADIVATVNASAGVLQRVLVGLRTWLASRPQRTIELKVGDDSIKISGLSTETEDRLVEAFVRYVCERP